MGMRRGLAGALAVAALVAGCSLPFGGGDDPRPAGTPTVLTGTDVGELSEIVNLPIRPAAAIWQYRLLGVADERAPGPTDYAVTAVLRYAPADAAELARRSELHAPAEQARVRALAWFPPELTALAERDADGVPQLAVSRWGAEDFFAGSFTAGSLSRAGTSDWFVLELHTT